MPRKNFLQDFSLVSAPGSFQRIHHVELGEEDSTIVFTYTFPLSLGPHSIEFNVAILDVSGYPDDHTYFAFSEGDNIPQAIAPALESIPVMFKGCALDVFLEGFRDCLDQAVLPQDIDADSLPTDDFDSNGEPDDMDWDQTSGPDLFNSTDLKRLRVDLRAVKEAGFKVGYLGDQTGALIVSISCRVAKLGISEDAMQMWDILPSQFLVLLLHYPQGYAGLDRILSQPDASPDLVRVYIGFCGTYKPTMVSVPDASHANVSEQIFSPGASTSETQSRMKSSFITDPLQGLFKERFLDLIRDRLEYGFSWTGAELFYNDHQGKPLGPKKLLHSKYRCAEQWSKSTPGFVKADELSQQQNTVELALPLVAMQYTVRRFVKCTEFCLNCHCKIDAGFEALKPYVCSNPLCLYQYMQLGMGPKLEWEIVSQPYVVDMLVSFTYVRAMTRNLTELPVGLGLKVPSAIDSNYNCPAQFATFDARQMILGVNGSHELAVGQWIVIKNTMGASLEQKSASLHCTVLGTDGCKYMSLSAPVPVGFVQGDDSWKHTWRDVTFIPYNVDFDDLNLQLKMEAINTLLDTLPDVHAMKEYITNGASPEQNTPLATWTHRISPSALYVLRWIVASNRSCIVHDDDPKHQVTGMQGYMQFRLAQGSPDKEKRFVQAIACASSKKHPTLFAWHGSPLHNWHNIVRQGLNFETVLHGRSYGNGVYMASDFLTSYGYTRVSSNATGWGQSQLKITGAISLNEVVNAPKTFLCSSPFFVVSQLDWIQPRYLFLMCESPRNQWKASTVPTQTYTQDPQHPVLGPNRDAIHIPISALGTRNSKCQETTQVLKEAGNPASGHAKKKRKLSGKGIPKGATVIVLDDDKVADTDSVATLAEDLRLLESDTEDEEMKDLGSCEASKRTYAHDDLSKTDFRPGTLHSESLQLLEPPSYASSTATQSLQRHLRETLKVQDRTPLHELGWYVDTTLINTVYQWIVELHSFDPGLPLAQDLKKYKLASVVLELRFPPNFPLTPPFVRVIRPRFLPFTQNGGGHVTIGGAMCMELLTSSGWLPTTTMESVLLQVRMALCSTDPRPARLQYGMDYSFGGAVEDFQRACLRHGWLVPEDFPRLRS
ncbi:ubiquitin conjugating enzyme [Aspergillus heteromorphus CBS 117.55]|uniref:Ubiquitin conjugating enzyme n=1 Tax=Aspergillus heteromorphus CBS 117.55 TaxID=1448321 RepID=A0A317WIZ9_9EURO|nr:ubiquitin conjugating enzyme [Aspergillus heteromorphus CBS 117.55]PWY85038.1 ubiquitin conjugating enzyme [Aspergillus heteromorphus CBS 117.55]